MPGTFYVNTSNWTQDMSVIYDPDNNTKGAKVWGPYGYSEILYKYDARNNCVEEKLLVKLECIVYFVIAQTAVNQLLPEYRHVF